MTKKGKERRKNKMFSSRISISAQRRCRISLSFNFRVRRNGFRILASLTLTPWFGGLRCFLSAWNLNVPIDARSLFSLLLETRQRLSRRLVPRRKWGKILKIYRSSIESMHVWYVFSSQFYLKRTMFREKSSLRFFFVLYCIRIVTIDSTL